MFVRRSTYGKFLKLQLRNTILSSLPSHFEIHHKKYAFVSKIFVVYSEAAVQSDPTQLSIGSHGVAICRSVRSWVLKIAPIQSDKVGSRRPVCFWRRDCARFQSGRCRLPVALEDGKMFTRTNERNKQHAFVFACTIHWMQKVGHINLYSFHA